MTDHERVSFRLHGRTRHTRAVVALMHGGIGVPRPTAAWQDPAYLRMVPFVPSVLTAGRGRVAAAVVRHPLHGWLRQRRGGGWDGSDVHRGGALDQLIDDLAAVTPEGGTLHLIGHSSGGWAALRALSDERVTSVLGLAPWVDRREPLPSRTDVRVAIAHGAIDSVTSSISSQRYVERLRQAGIDATFWPVNRGDHAMLLNLVAWQLHVRRFVGDYVRA